MLEPLSKESRSSLATLLNREKRYGKAMAMWDQALLVDAEDSHAWNGKSSTAYHQGDYQRALNYINAALWTINQESVVWGMLATGKSSFKQRNEQTMRASYLFKRADIQLAQENVAGAIEDYRTVHKEFPQETNKELMQKATSATFKGQTSRSQMLLEALLELSPDEPAHINGYVVLATLYNNQGKNPAEWMNTVLKTLRASKNPTKILDLVGLKLGLIGGARFALPLYCELVNTHHKPEYAANIRQIAQII